MAKREKIEVTGHERLQHDNEESKRLSSSFAPYIDKKNNNKSEKSFAEVVNEQARVLPALNSSSTLPLSMTEILRNSSPQTTRWIPRLPTISAGQVQLVHSSTNADSKMSRKDKRRLKRERKTKGHRKNDSSRSHHDVDCDDDNDTLTWKKKLHHREKKRLIDEGESTLGLAREFRLPTLQEIHKCLTNEERRKLARGDVISKEGQRKREFMNIIKEETKLRQYFDTLLSSYDDDVGDKDGQSSRVTQRMERALIERQRYFSTNPPRMARTTSLPSVFNTTVTPRKTIQNNNNLAAFLKSINNNASSTNSNDRFPSLLKQGELSARAGLSKDESSLTMPVDRRIKVKIDEVVESRGRTLTYPLPAGSRRSLRCSIREACKSPRVDRWKIKLHKRRYTLCT